KLNEGDPLRLPGPFKHGGRRSGRQQSASILRYHGPSHVQVLLESSCVSDLDVNDDIRCHESSPSPISYYNSPVDEPRGGAGRGRGGSLDHFIRPRQHRRRDRQAQGFRSLEVYDQLERRRLLDACTSPFRWWALICGWSWAATCTTKGCP